jgi:tRNA pseudouridine13 synthase
MHAAVPAAELSPDDPLPRRRLLPPEFTAGIVGGVIKEREEDFLVDELPLYQPSGEGEHVYLGVQKQGMPHSEMIEVLAKHFGVGEEAIGFAGMKDKVAVTRQMVSVHMPGREPPAVAFRHDRMAILWQSRHANKLRRGHLAGNRFSIRIRRLEPLKATSIWRSLQRLERDGIPDYYGAQRFGYRRNTHRLGRHLLNGDAEAFLAELLGTVSPYPPHQREVRERFDAKDYAGALRLWGRNDRAERAALVALADGRALRAAMLAIPRHIRDFFVSAFQSAVFNRLLDQRLESGLLSTLVEGDVAYKHESRGQFTVTKEILESEDLAARVRSFELSPSGPMFGRGMIEPSGEVREAEHRAARAFGVAPETLLAKELDLDGTRRPFRVPVTNTELDAGFDEHGPYIRLAFDLPRGAYATVLLRELLGDAVPADDEGAREQT